MFCTTTSAASHRPSEEVSLCLEDRTTEARRETAFHPSAGEEEMGLAATSRRDEKQTQSLAELQGRRHRVLELRRCRPRANRTASRMGEATAIRAAREGCPPRVREVRCAPPRPIKPGRECASALEERGQCEAAAGISLHRNRSASFRPFGRSSAVASDDQGHTRLTPSGGVRVLESLGCRGVEAVHQRARRWGRHWLPGRLFLR
mmetsp:Transcript_21119/g.61646  ORF Transcript_21119/g.61646 Transcript_21119/m.61646 type:complete len:205 (+) Transcript_21119:317-931(+)